MINYKEPAIYDAGGDVTKQWFIFYSYVDPSTGKYRRFKVFLNINTYNLKNERTVQAIALRKALSELLQEGFNPFEEFKPGGQYSISNCIDIFLDSVKDNLRPKSYSRYYYELRIFKTWLKDNRLHSLHISRIKRVHVFTFLEFCKMKGNWTSGKTYNTHKGNLSRFFNYFINNYDDVIEVNPVSKIESKPVVVKGNIPYNDHEFKAVRDCILEHDPYLWRICQLVYYAAVRNEQEGLNLRIKDVDFASKQIIIGADVTKGKERQMIPIYPEFLEILKTWQLHKYPGHYYIFGRGDKPGTTRIGVNRFSKRFRKIKQKIGLGENYGIYSFKHTRGCHMVDDGASLYEIQT